MARVELPKQGARLVVTLEFAPDDVHRAEVWRERLESGPIGAKFLEEFDAPRLLYEAAASNAVSPKIVEVKRA